MISEPPPSHLCKQEGSTLLAAVPWSPWIHTGRQNLASYQTAGLEGACPGFPLPVLHTEGGGRVSGARSRVLTKSLWVLVLRKEDEETQEDLTGLAGVMASDPDMLASL